MDGADEVVEVDAGRSARDRSLPSPADNRVRGRGRSAGGRGIRRGARAPPRNRRARSSRRIIHGSRIGTGSGAWQETPYESSPAAIAASMYSANLSLAVAVAAVRVIIRPQRHAPTASLKRRMASICSCGECRPAFIVLTVRCVAPSARQPSTCARPIVRRLARDADARLDADCRRIAPRARAYSRICSSICARRLVRRASAGTSRRRSRRRASASPRRCRRSRSGSGAARAAD